MRQVATAGPRVVFLDQGVGRLIKGLAVATAEKIGPVIFLTAEQNVSSTRVRVIRLPQNVNSSVRERLWGWARFVLGAGGFLLFRVRGRPLLFIVTNPPVSPILGVVAKKLRRQRYVLLYYDMYPEALEKLRGVSSLSLVSRVLRALNRLAVANAEAVVTISPQLAATLRQYYRSDEAAARVQIIPTWAETTEIFPRPKEDNWFARQHNQVGKLTVFYSGNIGAVHDLRLLPAVAHRLRDYSDIHFLIVGEGAGRASLERQCSELQLPNVTFLSLQPEDVMPFSLATADISIVALAEGGKGVSMPSKTFYMMAAGSALLGISNSDSDLASVIREHNCGVNIEPEDAAGAADAILRFRNDPASLLRARENARSAAVRYYSADVCIPQMVALLESVLGPAELPSRATVRG